MKAHSFVKLVLLQYVFLLSLCSFELCTLVFSDMILSFFLEVLKGLLLV